MSSEAITRNPPLAKNQHSKTTNREEPSANLETAIDIKESGRVPAEVIEKYNAAEV